MASKSNQQNRRLVLGLALAGVVSLCDLASPAVNLSILNGVVFLWAVAKLPARRGWLLAGVMAILLVGGLAIKLRVYPDALPAEFAVYRYINRGFIILMLLLILVGVTLWIKTARSSVTQADDFDTLMQTLLPVVAFVLSLLFAGVVAVTDLSVPANYNLSSLYLVPLFVSSWLGRRRVIWALFVILLAATLCGLWFGPAATDASLVGTLIQNRVMTGIMLALAAVLLHFEQRGIRRAHADDEEHWPGTVGLNAGS